MSKTFVMPPVMPVPTNFSIDFDRHPACKSCGRRGCDCVKRPAEQDYYATPTNVDFSDNEGSGYAVLLFAGVMTVMVVAFLTVPSIVSALIVNVAGLFGYN